MPYVMMPVPEEHVEAVMNFVLRAIARASIEPWTAESINQTFSEIDEASRSLLAFVARDSVEGTELDAAEEARKVQLTVREVVGIMNELNTATREANRPNLINSRMITERMANGRTKERRVLQMDAEIAEFIRVAERAELQGAADPLGGAGE